MNDAETSDRELVTRFAAQRDEEAFALLVRRHAGLVLGVCRRVLGDSHDADDAFQATFLVLAKDAGRIRRRASLASWLYGVAYRTSLRALAARGRRREVPLSEGTAVADKTLDELTARDEQQAVDEELNALPQRYRDPLVLHYLDGKTNKEIAEELGLSVSAVEGRIKRGKKELRLRLARRGVGLSLALAALHAAISSAEAASETLIVTTVEAGVAYASGVTSSGSFSAEAASLADKELVTMSLPTLPTMSLMVLLVLAAGFLGSGPGQGAKEGQAPRVLAGEPNPNGPAEPRPPVRLAMGKKKKAKDAKALPPNAPLSFERRAPAEEKIFAELDRPTAWAFQETPLSDVIVFIMDLHDVNIRVDRQAIVDAGTTPEDTLITVSLKGVSLRSAMRLMLDELDLDYVVANEVMLITTADAAATRVETRVYQIRHLQHHEPDSLAQAIQQTVRPNSWRDRAAVGEGDEKKAKAADKAVGSIAPLSGCLVITQSQRAHEEITDLLEQLGRHAP